MGWEGWFAVGVVAFTVVLLAASRYSPDVILVGALSLLMLSGVLDPQTALSGFSNEGMVTVGVLFVIVAGLRDTGAVGWIGGWLLGRPKSVADAQARLILPVVGLSGFMNNTPLVAMMIPVVSDWAKRFRLPASKLMIPLSYAAILGGTCTLIGTSTNLVVQGLLLESKLPGLRMFDITWVGFPAAIVGTIYLLLFSRWLLPDRATAFGPLDDPREYTVEMLVQPGSPLVGKTIEKAGLRHLTGMYLVEIDRAGMIMPAVGPETQLYAGDRLVFAGIVESVVELQKIRGLEPATDQVFKLSAPRRDRVLIEAVVSSGCPLNGQTIREGRFRSHYDAVVIAVTRQGTRINKKIGDIVIQPGDTLLLEAHPSWVDRMRNTRDFCLVSPIADSTPPRHNKAIIAIAALIGMVVLVTLEILPMLQAAVLASGVILLSRCCSASSVRRSVDWSLLVMIAASLGLGRALVVTGAADFISRHLITLAGGNAWGTLAIVYGLALLFTEAVTNNAAAALIFPIAMSAARDLGVSITPFAIAIMMAASNGFATPLGYQTHLMVMGPGGYRFADFIRIGLPLNFLIWAVTVAVTPLVYPF